MRWKIFLLILSLLISSSVMGTELEEIRKAIRQKGAKWEAGETSVSRLSPEERRRLLGDNLADDFLKAPGEEIRGTKDLPTEFDWRNKDGHFWMTPIKDQENCGACVAFGACGALEANIKIYANNPWIMPNLSEQELFSCGRGPGGCEYGWNLTSAMDYFLNNGTPDEACLPYTAVDDNCDDTCSDRTARARKISSWGWTSKLISDIKQAIYDYGPLEGHFYVYTDFFSYHGGVYEYVWGDYEGGHAIPIVGWSDSSLCWICRNSWGPNWGEYGPYPDSTRGWFRLKYGEPYCQLEERRAAWLIPVSKSPDGIVLDEESFHFALSPDSSDSDSLYISNVGDSTFIFNITFDQPWLFASPQSDTLDSNEVSLLDISVSSSGLLGGVYAGTLSVYARDPSPGEVPLYHFDVLVDLEVSCPFVRGDYDCDGVMLTNDPLMELQWIFGVPGATLPSCDDAADYDDNGNTFTNDPLMALQSIFGVPGSVPPQPPYPDCGYDPTSDDLYCVWHPFCMGGGKVLAYKPSMSVKDAVNKLAVGEVTPVDGVVRIPVDLTISEPVCGFDISVGYDASSLRFKEVVGGDGYDFYAVDTREDGIVRIGGVPDIEMADLMGAGTHRVAEIVFITEKEADVELDWRKVEVYGSNVEALSVEWIDGVVKEGAGLPTEFALSQNYPNPFNPTALIRYDLPEDCQVRLDIYNVVGQRVATLVDGQQKAGYKLVSWNAQDMSSGVYFYKLTAGDFASIRKMVLLK